MQLRDLVSADEPRWLELWEGYVTFYEANVPKEVSSATFKRAITRGSGLLGRVALEGDRIVGFSHSILHPGTWSTAPICYLEDLFVDPAARGKGVGRALIEDLISLGKSQGWAKLYWHTKASNATARRLYDCFTLADDFVRYRLPL